MAGAGRANLISPTSLNNAMQNMFTPSHAATNAPGLAAGNPN